nr:response regulator [Rhodoferax sp. U2-2l]
MGGCFAKREVVFVVSLRIFLVEDSLTIRVSLMDMLTDLADACLVGVAEQQADAIQWLSEHPDGWDVAIVDIFLKRGSGLPVLSACAGRSPKQRVLVLSNYATSEMRAQALRLGVDRVFDKSQDVDALIDYCRQVGLDVKLP